MNATPPVLSGVAAARDYAGLVADPLGYCTRLHSRHGRVFALDAPLTRRWKARRTLFLADEGPVERVLERPESYRTVGLAVVRGPTGSAQRRLRDGIVRMNGPEQAALRRAYAPSLAKTRLCQDAPKLAAICEHEVAQWPRGAVFDAAVNVKLLVRRAASTLLFGAGDDPMALRVADIVDRHSRLQSSPSVFLLPVPAPGTPYHALLRDAERVEEALIAWIEAHPQRSNDLVSCVANMCDSQGAPMSRRAQAAQLWTLYGASFETTSTTLCWVLLHLAWNPEVARRLWQDVAAMGEGAPYLDAVIAETLRMTPTVAFQMRRAVEDGALAGLALSRGDRIVLSALVLNRDPEIYQAPDAFLPDRWQATSQTALRPLAFSAGPRRCLGFHFAIMVLKAALTAIALQVRFDLAKDQRIGVRLAITQCPTHVPLIARPSDERFEAVCFSGPAARQMTSFAGEGPAAPTGVGATI